MHEQSYLSLHSQCARERFFLLFAPLYSRGVPAAGAAGISVYVGVLVHRMALAGVEPEKMCGIVIYFQEIQLVTARHRASSALLGAFQAPYRTLLLSAIGSTSFRKNIFFRFHLVDFIFPSFSSLHSVDLDNPDISMAFSTDTSASSILIPPCLFDLHLQFFRYGFLLPCIILYVRFPVLSNFFINESVKKI